MAFSESQADVNATLFALKYTGDQDFNGQDNLKINADDQGNNGTGPAATANVVIDVNAVNDAVAITSDGGGDTARVSIAENTTDVTTVTAQDVDADPLTYTINGGADAGLFGIDAGTGDLSFLFGADFENPLDAGGDNVYDVTVEVTDGSVTDSQDIAVTVEDASALVDFDPGTVAVTTTVASLDSEEFSFDVLSPAPFPGIGFNNYI